MNLTPNQIAHFARQGGARFGTRGCMVIAQYPSGEAACWNVIQAAEGSDAATVRAQAQEGADEHARRHRDKTFHVVEFGAPVVAEPAFSPALSRAVELIESMRGLIDDAMWTHVYDADNGDKPDEGCGYQAAIDAADAFLDANLMAPVQLYVSRTENDLDIWAPGGLPGVEIVTLNYDIDDLAHYDTSDVTMVRFGEGEFEPCLVARSVVTGDGRVPDMRPATDEDMGDGE